MRMIDNMQLLIPNPPIRYQLQCSILPPQLVTNWMAHSRHNPPAEANLSLRNWSWFECPRFPPVRHRRQQLINHIAIDQEWWGDDLSIDWLIIPHKEMPNVKHLRSYQYYSSDLFAAEERLNCELILLHFDHHKTTNDELWGRKHLPVPDSIVPVRVRGGGCSVIIDDK